MEENKTTDMTRMPATILVFNRNSAKQKNKARQIKKNICKACGGASSSVSSISSGQLRACLNFSLPVSISGSLTEPTVNKNKNWQNE